MDIIGTRVRVLGRVLQREAAEHYLFLTLLSFAISVSVTRLYLSLANYPRIGSGELHIAHVLWGGLLLYAAALLPLLFANRAIYTYGALLAGTGVGLFIDEVGKFITTQNDYFYPVAASIIYVVFLLTLVGFFHVRRMARTRARDELTHAFEDVWEALQHTLTPRQYARLKQRLEVAARAAPSEKHANLANALMAFVDADAVPTPIEPDHLLAATRPFRRIIGRVFSENTLRVILILGLTGIGLLTLKNPVTVLLGPVLPPSVTTFLDSLRLGRHVDASVTSLWSTLRLALEVIVGVLLLTSAALLTARKKRLGSAVGYVGLLLCLTTVDVLLFYFEQFSTIITTGIQFALWLGIILYRRHRA